MGYHRAGFEVVGVDIKPQKNYPFEFHQADAIEFGRKYGREFSVIHASPPCQGYTTMNQRWNDARESHPKLIAETREILKDTGKEYIIENVCGAKAEMDRPFQLCGSSFGLGVRRHRLFECSFFILIPECSHIGEEIPVYGKLDGRRLWTRTDGTELRAPKELSVAAEAMDINWMDWDELREAIPPAYTEYIGRQLMQILNKKKGQPWQQWQYRQSIQFTEPKRKTSGPYQTEGMWS